ncbi:MAG: hypothetical protein Ct9H300mP11_28630 [Chloroflexota bacterium]|nr:MAG: hypothetical protein Ct9H300mP11_28630 [Chloroflexota bacterium]
MVQLEKGIMVHLIETPDAPVKPENTHHAFEVEDFEGTMKTLEENGFEILRHGVRFDGQGFMFINDPDGNRVSSARLRLLPGPWPSRLARTEGCTCLSSKLALAFWLACVI